MNKINCPNCDIEMNEVVISSHYGIKIPIEQCSRCGGLWFDEVECFRASHGEHKKLENYDEKKFSKNVELKTELFCPKDGNKLKILKDKYFSENIEVEYCNKCSGFWFNHGEFGDYQKERSEKKVKTKPTKESDDELERKLDELLASTSVQSKYNALGDIGRILSGPASRSSLSKTNQANYSPSSQLIHGVFLVITSLIAMMAGRRNK